MTFLLVFYFTRQFRFSNETSCKYLMTKMSAFVLVHNANTIFVQVENEKKKINWNPFIAIFPLPQLELLPKRQYSPSWTNKVGDIRLNWQLEIILLYATATVTIGGKCSQKFD